MMLSHAWLTTFFILTIYQLFTDNLFYWHISTVSKKIKSWVHRLQQWFSILLSQAEVLYSPHTNIPDCNLHHVTAPPLPTSGPTLSKTPEEANLQLAVLEDGKQQQQHMAIGGRVYKILKEGLLHSAVLLLRYQVTLLSSVLQSSSSCPASFQEGASQNSLGLIVFTEGLN